MGYVQKFIDRQPACTIGQWLSSTTEVRRVFFHHYPGMPIVCSVSAKLADREVSAEARAETHIEAFESAVEKLVTTFAVSRP